MKFLQHYGAAATSSAGLDNDNGIISPASAESIHDSDDDHDETRKKKMAVRVALLPTSVFAISPTGVASSRMRVWPLKSATVAVDSRRRAAVMKTVSGASVHPGHRYILIVGGRKLSFLGDFPATNADRQTSLPFSIFSAMAEWPTPDCVDRQ